MAKILITGTAGFIGYHLVNKLLSYNFDVVGLDIINDYYDVNLKYDRLRNSGIEIEKLSYNKLVVSSKINNYKFIKLDLSDKKNLLHLFEEQKFDFVCNLAAQAGVRYSIDNPQVYIDSNITGFLNILECCKAFPVKHLLYASSSSVYGLNNEYPLSCDQNVDHPISLYAATKKSNELMAHTYSHLFNIPTSGLRFFTVYGPWGRPDMALFKFTKAILNNESMDVYNYGNMERDFTYIGDIVEGIRLVLENPPLKATDESIENNKNTKAPYAVYNIGNSKPELLGDFVSLIEKYLDKKATINYLPIQPGDVAKTWSDVTPLKENFSYQPLTSIEVGIKKFIEWYKNYYNSND